MTTQEIKDALLKLQEMEYLLEDEYNNNGGEVTESTEQQENAISALRELLTTDGVDSLGRWIKAKEDQIKALKAEKDIAARKIKKCEATIDYIKSQVNMILVSTGTASVKGTFYGFAPYTSTKTEVNKDVLNANYKERVSEAIKAAGIPHYIGFSLTASADAAKQFGISETDKELFKVSNTPSVKFTKPREYKEEK